MDSGSPGGGGTATDSLSSNSKVDHHKPSPVNNYESDAQSPATYSENTRDDVADIQVVGELDFTGRILSQTQDLLSPSNRDSDSC